MLTDFLESLRADLAREHPDVDAAVEQEAFAFLRAAVTFTRSMLSSDNPWAAVGILASSLVWLHESQSRLDTEIKQTSPSYWRESRDPIDQAAAIFDALACGRPQCSCRHGKLTHCPGHIDSSPSFSVAVKGDRVLLHCFTGCSQSAVIAALKQRGLWSAPRPMRGGVA